MRTREPADWMWEQACAMLERAERMQRQSFLVRSDRHRGPVWEPPTDIIESGQELTIEVALPGVPSTAIDVLIEGNALVVRGSRSLTLAEGSVIHRLEVPYGRFEKRVVLESGHLELIQRQLENGCLTLRFRKLG